MTPIRLAKSSVTLSYLQNITKEILQNSCFECVMNVAEILPLKKIRRQLIHQTFDVELKKSEGPTSASDSVRTKPAAHCPDTLRYSMHLSFFQMSRLFFAHQQHVPLL